MGRERVSIYDEEYAVIFTVSVSVHIGVDLCTNREACTVHTFVYPAITYMTNSTVECQRKRGFVCLMIGLLIHFI